MQKFTGRTQETTTTTGTGAITLAGAAAGSETFAVGYAVGEPFQYTIQSQTGSEFEAGEGRLSSAAILARDNVRHSSNAGALVNLSAGTKDVFITPIACLLYTSDAADE